MKELSKHFGHNDDHGDYIGKFDRLNMSVTN